MVMEVEKRGETFLYVYWKLMDKDLSVDKEIGFHEGVSSI